MSAENTALIRLPLVSLRRICRQKVYNNFIEADSMKFFFAVAVAALYLTVFVEQVRCQGVFRAGSGFSQVEDRPLRVETPLGKAMFLEASTIERRSASVKFKNIGTLLNWQPSLFHLKGNVVIKMDCFLP